MKCLLIPFLALALCPPAQAYYEDLESKTAAELSLKGENCNFFQKEPLTWFHHVQEKRTATVDVMGTWGNEFAKYKGGDYSARRYKTDCTDTQVRLFCSNGDCWVSMNSGRHGYHPGKRNTVIIDGSTFSWIGDMPIETGRKMWSALKEGSVVKSSIVRWPSGYTNFKDVLNGVEQSKFLVYRISLEGENYKLPKKEEICTGSRIYCETRL